jgi:hypothetical protein
MVRTVLGIANYSRRTGDGEFVSRKGGGGSKEAVLEVVLDGYSAPLTAGHFAQLLEEKYYDNATIAGCAIALNRISTYHSPLPALRRRSHPETSRVDSACGGGS